MLEYLQILIFLLRPKATTPLSFYETTLCDTATSGGKQKSLPSQIVRSFLAEAEHARQEKKSGGTKSCGAT